jgi:hypothetical protein
MKKTLNINIAGQLFSVDEEAYQVLARYLEHVAAKFRTEPGGEETFADIEARIAEIFGGGNEPPRLVSREMVNGMIETMGAPEAYYDAGTPDETPRKSMYDPGSPVARVGQALSALRKAGGLVFSKLLRFFAVILGVGFSLFGFFLMVIFVLLFFFTGSVLPALIKDPGILNLPMLLSIALSTTLANTIWTLAAVVILIPLAALSYLGIKLIFRIKAGPKLIRVLLFTTWIAALCVLVVMLVLRFADHANHDWSEQKVVLEPAPKTVWVAPLKKISDAVWDEKAMVDGFTFRKNSRTGQLYVTADLEVWGSDTTSAWISVEKQVRGKTQSDAKANLRKIDFTWKFSRDTLYLDEYFSLPAGEPWNGALLSVDMCMPEGTVIKPVSGISLASWCFQIDHPEVKAFRIKEGYAQAVEE